MSGNPFQPGPQPPPLYRAPEFRCPYCQSNAPPFVVRETSQTGMILTVLLLFLCFPLFWVGLMQKEEVRKCSACGAKWG